jgi:intein/homing endonuclease
MVEPGDIVRWVYGRILGRPMNFSFIDGYVSASARPFSNNEVNWLRANGIGAMLSLTEKPITQKWTDRMDYRSVPMKNHAVPTVTQLAESVNFLISEAQQNRKTNVHCFVPSIIVGSSVPTEIAKISGYATGRDGATHRIIRKIEHIYNGPLFRVKARGTLPIISTPEHPFLVYRPHKEPKGYSYKPNWIGRGSSKYSLLLEWQKTQPTWVLANSLALGDFLLSPIPFGNVDETHRVRFEWKSESSSARTVREPLESEDLAWLLGMYASDGSSIGPNSLQLTLGKDDDIDRTLRAFGEFGIEPAVKEHENYTRVRVHSRTLTYNFRKWFGTSSLEKHLPEFLTKWNAKAVLAGLTDGDAHYNYKRASSSFLSVSLTLAYQVWHLALINGWYPYIREYKRVSGYFGSSPAWTVEWREKNTFHYTAKWSGYYCMPITSIDRLPYSGPVFNLEMEGDHTYLANGVIVHNCAAGKGRTGTVLAAYLCRKYGLNPKNAIARVRSKRRGSIEKKQEEAVFSYYAGLMAGG